MTALLDFLAGWFSAWVASATTAAEARYGRSADDIQVRSAWIDLQNHNRWGQVTIWETGRYELEVNDVETVDLVASDSGEIATPEEASRLMERLLELLSTEMNSE